MQKQSFKFVGIGIDINISKNVYICIIKIYNHVRTFNARDFQRKSIQL